MAESFSLHQSVSDLAGTPDGTLKLLVTGAAGRIGSYFAEHADGRYDLRLMCHDADDASVVESLGEVIRGDVTELDDVKQACEGVDVMLHLAADPSPTATWSSLLPTNVIGTYNAFAAAKAAGVRRVVYASSIHAVSGFAKDRQVHPHMPVNPGDLYGVTKCFGEALGRYMAEREGVSCVAVRIGAFQPLARAEKPGSHVLLDAFVSRRDLNQLLQKAVEAEHVQFAIVHGLSDNRFKRMDIQTARELLGYDPQDDLSEMNDDLAKLHLHDADDSHAVAGPGQSGLRNDL